MAHLLPDGIVVPAPAVAYYLALGTTHTRTYICSEDSQMRNSIACKVTLSLALALSAAAGPILIDGTDANEHGSVSAGVNIGGWEYMQRAFQNVGGQCTGCVKVVTVLGTTAGSTARLSVSSAFNLSTLPGLGWTINFVPEASIAATIASLSFATTGILHIPTVGNASGDLSTAGLGIINGQGAAIAAFVNAGGGLWAMSESPSAGTAAFGWLSSVIPGIVVTDAGSGGVSSNILLTAAGTTAFPGLTNADLSGADPWHDFFSGDLGSLQILGTSVQGGVTRNVIIGGGSGSVLVNSPEPGTSLLLSLGLAAIWLGRRRMLS